MDNVKQHLDNLQEVKQLMDKNARFLSLSGFSGIFAGFFALIGAAIIYYSLFESFSFSAYSDRFPLAISIKKLFFMGFVAIVVLVLSISFSIYFTSQKAKKQHLPLWDETAFRTIINLVVPLLVGGVFCLILIYHAITPYGLDYTLFGLVAPTTLVFYGVALYNAGKFTLNEIRYLGVSEMVLGLFGCIFIGWGLIFWIIGFGFFHILYGFLMWWKYERKS